MILLAAVFASLVDFDRFLAAATAVNAAILDAVGPLFSFAPFIALLLIIAICLSPLGRVRIGGEDAAPILSRWNWFAITLCTTIATGILFWGAAEPIFHLNDPPTFAGAAPLTREAGTFALSTLYFHWSFTPYAIYTAVALAFALAYYNLGAPYSLSGPLSIAFGRVANGFGSAVTDGVALFALVAGVSASLGAGILTLVGGVDALTDAKDTAVLRFFIAFTLVTTFIGSSLTGLHRGIKIFSDINVRVFFLIALFIFIAGPTIEIIKMTAKSLPDFFSSFVRRSLVVGGEDENWIREWTTFNFSQWAAWAPITGLFLGRIAVGYRVREMVLMNLVLPASFGIIWMSIFGGAALSFDFSQSGALSAALTDDGPEAVIYRAFDALPFTSVVVTIFLFATFISFVTAMDSNTHSIASVCLRAKRQEDEAQGAGLWLKLFWGVLIGAVAWIMTVTNGVAGVKMLSNLGGAPALIILIGSMIALMKFLFGAYANNELFGRVTAQIPADERDAGNNDDI